MRDSVSLALCSGFVEGGGRPTPSPHVLHPQAPSDALVLKQKGMACLRGLMGIG